MSDTITETTTLNQVPAKRLVRVDDGRWLGGVASGLGSYFDVNPLVYRIAFAALAFAGGTGILLYVAAWLVIPAEGSEDSTAVRALREHRERPWLLLGVGLLLFTAVLILAEADLWTGIGNVWLAALLGGSALLWWHLAHRGESRGGERPSGTTPPAPRAPRKPSLLTPVLGALLAAAGTFGLFAVLGVYTADVDLGLAAAVAIVGTAIAAGAFAGYRVGSLVAVGLVLLAGFGVAASSPVAFSSGVGEQAERPLDAAALQSSYEYGVGEYIVDLSAVQLEAGTTRIDVSLGIGELVVTVPQGVAVELDAHAGIGEVRAFGALDEGIGADKELTLAGRDADAPVLVLDADVGLGSVKVLRG